MPTPFSALLAETTQQSLSRAAITAATRRAEPACIAALLPSATLTPAQRHSAEATARRLVLALRAAPKQAGAAALIQEYALSSAEGVALMCLAEALLRIPDSATRDALIRDKISTGNWRAHLAPENPLFVNAATWGLVITGRLTGASDEPGLANALTKLLARGGEPIIRKAVDLAMRLMGEQFVLGETIEKALSRAQTLEAQGFRYSYDMLGEAALTAQDAETYFAAYAHAIRAIGAAGRGRGIYNGPGISIKLSALHPRYTRSQRARVLGELLPRLRELAHLAQSYDIGMNIDAEESERLDLSLDLLEALCEDPALAGWHGIGFVVQAYQKRAPFVLDHCIALASRTGHRLMLRLVKGAYWDSEIKRAQEAGLEDFPVFTRKRHTDISYIACAQKLLAAGATVFPQFATHNALTLATIHAMAEPGAAYEFQCLHGMGEALYQHVVSSNSLSVPCRIYAPVGTHETLLAYLVRRLLENGANASFVNRIADPAISIEALLTDPAAITLPVTPHPSIAMPSALFAPRPNSAGLDLANEQTLGALAFELAGRPMPAPATPPATDAAIAAAYAAAANNMPPAARAAALNQAADLLQANQPTLIALLVTEAGKTIPNAISEIREAIDFLRYYAAGIADVSTATHTPLGIALCISPWNFPLAIFLGQAAAAFAAGNAVIAKPAEETPRIAAYATSLLHQAGIPPEALQLLHGDGAIGATLVAHPGTDAVIFTGSTAAAKHIQHALSHRLSPSHTPIPLIAETGGINAMVVDSSALPEQVVADVLLSAFDSAGQRCSALRLLCLQQDIAPKIIPMLSAAMAELTLGQPDRLATDIGPVITQAAAAAIHRHIEAMRAAGHAVTQHHPTPDARFVPPTLIEIEDITDLQAEIFGPVLHILTYKSENLDSLIDSINATGYGLTFGLHTRIDSTIARVTSRIQAGNIYINRNTIGAVVGSQPFGGHGLSGTGPKAGGPLYLHRLLRSAPQFIPTPQTLPGPVGEINSYTLHPRGTVLCLATNPESLALQIAAATAANCPHTTNPTTTHIAILTDHPTTPLPTPPGAITPILTPPYNPAWLLTERTTTTNTTAAGGNASLMALGDE